MKIEMDQGQPVVDARYLGELLGLDPADVQVKMRAGEITSRFEIDEGEEVLSQSFGVCWAGARMVVAGI